MVRDACLKRMVVGVAASGSGGVLARTCYQNNFYDDDKCTKEFRTGSEVGAVTACMNTAVGEYPHRQMKTCGAAGGKTEVTVFKGADCTGESKAEDPQEPGCFLYTKAQADLEGNPDLAGKFSKISCLAACSGAERIFATGGVVVGVFAWLML